MNTTQKIEWPFFFQTAINTCGLTCLKMIHYYYKKEMLIMQEHDKLLSGRGISIFHLRRIAEQFNYSTLVLQVPVDFLMTNNTFPCIAFWRNNHFVVIYEINEKYIYVADPALGMIKMPLDKFTSNWMPSESLTGTLLLVEPNL